MGVEKRIKIIRGVHYGVLFLFFVSLYLILKTESLGLYGATAILFMGGIQYGHKGDCPLTTEEHKALEKLGIKAEGKFVQNLIANRVGINVPTFIITAIAVFAFIISGLRLGDYFLSLI